MRARHFSITSALTKAALKAYTLNSAYINFIEHETGSIEVGKQADLTVLDKNLFDLKSSEISEASVLYPDRR